MTVANVVSFFLTKDGPLKRIYPIQ